MNHRRTFLHQRVIVRLWIPAALLLIVGAMIVHSAGASPGGAPVGGSDAAMPTRQGVRVSLAEVFFIQRHPSTREVEWLGSGIVWFLLILSAANVALTAGLAWENRRENIAPDPAIGRSLGLMRERRADELIDFTRTDESYFGRVMHSALEERTQGVETMLRLAQQTGEEHALRRLRKIEPLNIIGNVAPMIGLFGTVYGMILAFREIVAAGGTPDPVNLAAGIGTALVTTFWGLIVAIPALSAYALLRNRIDELTAHASREADRAIEMLREKGQGAIVR